MYAVRILRLGRNYGTPEADPVIWEHGRRNLALRLACVLAIVGPISDGSEIAGVSIFNASLAQVERITASDPAVQAGVQTFGVHPAMGFPGGRLLGQPLTRAH